MTEVVMDTEQAVPAEGTGKCPQPGCLRGFPHEGVRHRYAPTKELQPEPEAAPLAPPVPDARPFAGSIEDKPRNHAVSIVDDGLMVAWDTCYRCKFHITRCDCPSGPLEPEYITRWRTKDFPINDPAPEVSAVDLARQIGDDVRRSHIDVDGNDALVPVETGEVEELTDADMEALVADEPSPLAQSFVDRPADVADDIDPEVGF